MRNIELIIEYDGTRYAGWEKSQKNTKDASVSEKIEEVLFKMEDAPVILTGAVRIESGAHALRQVANFKTESKKSVLEIKQYLRRYLPMDIAVVEALEVPERFHAAFNAKQFTFEYHISIGEVPSVFERRYRYYCFKKPDVAKMKEAAKAFIGTHDFKAFSDNPRMKKSTERTIKALDIYSDETEILITVTGDDFWPNMVRNIVGLILSCGLSETDCGKVPELIESKDRNLIPQAPEPKGLFLAEVEYE
ncbi:MAG: tRNA pseudouridine(38-40) synthase TruA [Lachnospiraceae bacterium]|nr:tRNA pseudouridine(38-40) synthase TruA [Lachnospiraceae bacterium]